MKKVPLKDQYIVMDDKDETYVEFDNFDDAYEFYTKLRKKYKKERSLYLYRTIPKLLGLSQQQ